MFDFVKIKTKSPRNGIIEIYPEFLVKRSSDLMIKGKSFYAVWDQEKMLWSRDESDVCRIIDRELLNMADQLRETTVDKIVIKTLSDFSTNKWTEWQKYCKSLPDHYHELDSKVTFLDEVVKKEDCVSKRLSYNITMEEPICYNQLMQQLYEPNEIQKLEWAIGSVLAGDSKKIQKFIVLYGGPGTGKSTVLKIIQMLFAPYCSTFEARSIGSINNAFALEAFRNNPLVSIDHDGDLSRIEDNTRLNSIISHENMSVNEKFKSVYENRFNTFLFIGTNKPVKITDAKSGIIRRLIDISPTGNKIPIDEYNHLMNAIGYELGKIAFKCLNRYQNLGIDFYDDYIPTSMIESTNDFYNFIEDHYDFFVMQESVSLNTAWLRYKEYCQDSNVLYPFSKRIFKDELKNYFSEFKDRYKNERNCYVGFLHDKLKYTPTNKKEKQQNSWVCLDNIPSLFDEQFSDWPAQYASNDQNEVPILKWKNIKTQLKDIDTSKTHYVLPASSTLIMLDFDKKNEQGEKDLALNLEAANQFPKTYAEISKGGNGLHLYYFYQGDTSRLKQLFDVDIEIKTYSGNAAIRRKVIKCNDIPIATISSGLPLKEEAMLQDFTIQNERQIRAMIKKNLRKQVHAHTKPSMDFIYKILEDAYNSGICYDVTDTRPAIQQFALNATNSTDYCLNLINKMKFKSEESTENVDFSEERPIVFFDIEVFPNLLVICWKRIGEGNSLVRMINPSSEDVGLLIHNRLVGFNNREYDNHIIYAAMMGYNNAQLFALSQRIINEKDRNAKFGEAYNLSYTDIYDYCSAKNKISLKKWEIKLGIHHQELGLPWDQPVPKELWVKVADYCGNDVIATEAVWNATQDDFLARKILAEWVKMTPNDTTNSLTTRLIFGLDPNPQSQFQYTDLSTKFPGYEFNEMGIDKERYLPGVKIVRGKSIYKGLDPGEGGRAIGYPGIYYNVALLDVESMHANSALQLNIFGDYYTKRFEDLKNTRGAIKHGDLEAAKQIVPQHIHHYLDDAGNKKGLSNALKTAIVSVYGLTSAKFPNKFKDPRNVDNIVAKYGALFMIDLEQKVQELGYTVIHIKTDSIKIANADPYIIESVQEYGKQYGYNLEHEATYSKICLVNDAVYIAEVIEEDGKKIDPKWTATGTQFSVPYVFKTLFSKEPIEFEDLCETKSVKTALYLDMNEGLGEDEHDYHFIGKIGAFCPMKPGSGGGVLLREKSDKTGFDAVTGSKKDSKGGVYRWLESEIVKNLHKEADIDLDYYEELTQKAIATISEYGDFERFVSDDHWLNTDPNQKEEIPFN